MQKVQLVRQPQRPDGTFGTLYYPGVRPIFTGELPWRDNKTRISCIPAGTYKCTWGYSNRLGWCYRVLGVPGRSGIAIHPANYMGLSHEGFKQELHGCIALGTGQGYHGKQRIITSSRLALGIFNNSLDREPFILEITNGN